MSRSRAALGLMLVTAAAMAALWLTPYTPARRVRTTTAVRGEWVRTSLMSGVVAYAKEEPLLSPRTARVERVCVQPGDAVRKGDVLLVLEAGVEAAELAALERTRYQLQAAFAAAGEAAAGIGAQQEAAWLARETELRATIGASAIRAGMDGVVEAVYAEEGDAVQAGGLLGCLRNESRCVLVCGRTADAFAAGTPALLRREGTEDVAAKIGRCGAPNAEGMRQLWLEPLEPGALDGCAIGDRMTAEMVTEVIPECVLAPLSALAADGRIWYVEDGRACSAEAEGVKCSRDWAALDEEWLGRRVIVQPDGARLTEGCRVKEARAK